MTGDGCQAGHCDQAETGAGCCGHFCQQALCWDHCVQVEAGRGQVDQVDLEADHCDQSEAVAGGHGHWCHYEAELRCQAGH